jgi:hypothetical protein
MSNEDERPGNKVPRGTVTISDPLGSVTYDSGHVIAFSLGPTSSPSANTAIAMMRSLQGKALAKTDADHMETALIALTGMSRQRRDALEKMADKAVPSGFGVDEVPLSVLKAVLESTRIEEDREEQQRNLAQSNAIQKLGILVPAASAIVGGVIATGLSKLLGL